MSKPLAVEVQNYQQLHALFRKRSSELGISRRGLDALSGLADGHCSTLLTSDPKRHATVGTLFALLTSLGLSIVVIEDEKKLAAIAPWIGSRDEKKVNRSRRRSPIIPTTHEAQHGQA